ncbi:hypothetical protein ACJRO7_024476 [Eucalyptus globulus]|uniref:Uncharacterized protein n=1 Tax=Eucalyptus globulus TaxID=34317 RepID=A0ABD3K5M0_EUCGL
MRISLEVSVTLHKPCDIELLHRNPKKEKREKRENKISPKVFWNNTGTFNYQCGGEPPLPPLPPLPPPPLSLACFLVFCGDGDCVASADGHECQCHQGSANMLGLPALPCVQKCNLGAECDVGFGPPATPPPPSPPVKSSASPGNDAPSCSWNYRALSWMLLAAIVVLWI